MRVAVAQTKAKPAGQVVIGLSQEPTVFDPRLPHIEVDDGVYMSLFSPLWAVSPKGRASAAACGRDADDRQWRSFRRRPDLVDQASPWRELA